MIVRKTIPLKGILLFAGHHFIWLIAYMLLATILYKVVGWHRISISLLPVSLIGTAVAFDVGFKNIQSYDRVWEARKIWGSIVNSSRSWAHWSVFMFVTTALPLLKYKVLKQRLSTGTLPGWNRCAHAVYLQNN